MPLRVAPCRSFLSQAQGTVPFMGERVKRADRILVGGGIGAGKSVVLDALVDLGYETVQADRIGHRLLEPGGAAEVQVASRWPSVVRDERIDRALLAAIVFDDPEELAALEAITHPLIFDGIVAHARASSETPLAVEIAIPGLTDQLHDWFRLAVVAPVEVRVERAVVRGGDEADVRARVATQATEVQWREWADAAVVNDGSIEELRARVRRIIETVAP